MGKRKSKMKSAEGIIGGVFFMVGICMLIGAVMVYISGERFKKTAQTVAAVITDIESYRDSDGDSRHDVMVRYYINGREYEVELNEYSSSMYEGKELSLYVDPLAPGHIMTTNGTLTAALILGGMGVIFAVVGGMFVVMILKKGLKKRRLLEKGKVIYAEVTGGILCQNYRVNGRHPYKMDCKYEDVFSGDTYFFRSDYMWADPNLYIGGQVKVYTDPNNMSEYMVDIESVTGDGNEIYDFR